MSKALVLVSVLGGALGAAPMGTDDGSSISTDDGSSISTDDGSSISTDDVPSISTDDVPAIVTDVDPQLELSRAVDLDPLGDVVTVTGTGYDPGRGIYVAVCAMPPPGEVPTPCGGGIDLTGESRASVWISSHPPDYGDGLAQPYGPDGSFEVEVSVSAILTPTIDCREIQCAIVTRADHTRLADRSLDVVIPIWFRSELPEPEPEPEPEAEPEPEPEPDVVMPPPRGSAPTWPVWAASGAAALGLVAVHPRTGRRSRRAERSAPAHDAEVPQ